MVDHGKLLYMLERIRARCSDGVGVFHTWEGGDCHAECVQLAHDNLVEDVAAPDEQAIGHHMWRIVSA